MSIEAILQIIIGFVGLILIAIPFSKNKSSINYQHILVAIILQIILAFALLETQISLTHYFTKRKS